MNPKLALDQLDQQTQANIAKALWLPDIDPSKLPEDTLAAILSDKNSSKSFGERMQTRLRDLLAHPESFTPSYRKQYETLLQHSDSLTPHQAYVMTYLLGPDSPRGDRYRPDAGIHQRLLLPGR